MISISRKMDDMNRFFGEELFSIACCVLSHLHVDIEKNSLFCGRDHSVTPPASMANAIVVLVLTDNLASKNKMASEPI